MDRRTLLLAGAAVALAPQRALAAATASPLVLVTADLEARVVALDAATGRVRALIPTLGFPRSIEAVGAAAVVAHSELGAVTILDAGTLALAHVLHGFGEPRYTAAHRDGRHAFLSDAARGEVV